MFHSVINDIDTDRSFKKGADKLSESFMKNGVRLLSSLRDWSKQMSVMRFPKYIWFVVCAKEKNQQTEARKRGT